MVTPTEGGSGSPHRSGVSAFGSKTPHHHRLFPNLQPLFPVPSIKAERIELRGFRQHSCHPWPAIGSASRFACLRAPGTDVVSAVRIGADRWAAGADGPGLAPVPLPGLRRAVQRAHRHRAEPDLVPRRRDRPRRALASSLPSQPARPRRDVPGPRHRGQSRGGTHLGGQCAASGRLPQPGGSAVAMMSCGPSCGPALAAESMSQLIAGG